MLKLTALLALLSLFSAFAYAREGVFRTLLDYGLPFPEIGLPYFTEGPADSSTVFLLIKDKYADYHTHGSVFSKRFTPRYNAESITFTPRGWHSKDGFSGNADHLRHYTIENTLQDVREFITKVVDPKSTRKVILAGNGYGGMIAALAHNTLKLSFAAVVDTPTLGNSISSANEAEAASNWLPADVATILHNATSTAFEYLSMGRGDELVAPLTLCKVPRMDWKHDSATFWLNVVYPVVRALGAHTNDFPKSAANRFVIIRDLTGSGSPLEKLGRAVRSSRESHVSCINPSFDSYSADGFYADNDNLMTLVGKCIQLGTLPIPSTKQVFFPPNSGLMLTFFGDLCTRIMGPKFTLNNLKDGAAAFAKRYGGPSSYKAAKSFIIYSTADPLAALAPTTSSAIHSTSRAIAFKGQRGECFSPGGGGNEGEQVRFQIERFLDKLLK